MPETSEIQKIQNACVALSLLNKKHVYEVACALKFSEKKPIVAAGAVLAEDGDRGRGMTAKDKE